MSSIRERERERLYLRGGGFASISRSDHLLPTSVGPGRLIVETAGAERPFSRGRKRCCTNVYFCPCGKKWVPVRAAWDDASINRTQICGEAARVLCFVCGAGGLGLSVVGGIHTKVSQLNRFLGRGPSPWRSHHRLESGRTQVRLLLQPEGGLEVVRLTLDPVCGS